MEIIDRKFRIMAINPVNGKIYDESNSLLLCAKDKAVPAAIFTYKLECERLGANSEHIRSVELLYNRVKDFQAEQGGGRVPDTVGAEIPRCLGVPILCDSCQQMAVTSCPNMAQRGTATECAAFAEREG